MPAAALTPLISAEAVVLGRKDNPPPPPPPPPPPSIPPVTLFVDGLVVVFIAGATELSIVALGFDEVVEVVVVIVVESAAPDLCDSCPAEKGKMARLK